MKKTTLLLTLSTIITLSSSAQALELLVVNNYNEASSPDIWKKAKTDQVPDILLGNVSVTSPRAAYASMFPKTFFQEEMFAVCYKNCANNDGFRLRNGEIDSRDKSNWDVVEQSNVYFWLNRYFKFVDEKLSYRPDQFLKVTTNREIRDETQGKKLRNNAFFNPKDVSLSFLPATNNILFKLMGGKISRSGFDPSVVTHEASHYLFHHLFPNPVNDEIGGLNEGFADYIANIFLKNPKVGLVMMHGQTIRDSSEQVDKSGKLKTYEPGMEVHDLGERVSFALWKTRELADNKEELDRLVIDAVEDLGRNPYSTVHDFKIKMLERLPEVVSNINLTNARTIWEIAFSGNAIRIDNTNFLNLPVSTKPALGFRTKQVIPENLAREYGTKAVEESTFNILRMDQISSTQTAVLMSSDDGTPYWIALDSTRNNVLGIYDTSKRIVTAEADIERVKFLADQAKGAAATIRDFTSKIKSFSDLSQGKGDFNTAYKVKDRSTTPTSIVFNGTTHSGNVVRLNLKRRLLTGVLFGLPEIERIELFTVPVPQLTGLPEVQGQRVIGYKLLLKTGTAMEVILDNYMM